MEKTEPQTIEFDIRGQICPSSLLLALRELNTHKERLHRGEVRLSFRTDNRDATVTIPDAAANMGYGVRVTKTDGAYIVLVDNGE
jgi:TusA-related sulfurtransferase